MLTVKGNTEQFHRHSCLFVTGGQDQPAGGSAQRAAHFGHGVFHGVLLHTVLDALWHCGADGYLW